MINWKPIEELTEEFIRKEENFLLYGSDYYWFASRDNDHITVWIENTNFKLYELKNEYTHYALLTPPKS